MLAFEYPIRPFTFGPRSSPFFAMPYLAVGGVGPWAGWGSGPLGAATRCPRRRRPFHFFRDLAFFGDSERSGFGLHDGRRRRRNRAPPLKPPGSSNRKSPNFYRQIFFLKKKFWHQFFFGDFNYISPVFHTMIGSGSDVGSRCSYGKHGIWPCQ